MIFKVYRDNLWEESSFCFNNQWEIICGALAKDVPLGKVTLAIWVRKGRRKLVNGFVESVPDSVRDDMVGSRLVYHYVFKPTNPQRLRNILQS